ncbi:hypothetical protein ACLOJK_039762 [Asimina triloba]
MGEKLPGLWMFNGLFECHFIGTKSSPTRSTLDLDPRDARLLLMGGTRSPSVQLLGSGHPPPRLCPSSLAMPSACSSPRVPPCAASPPWSAALVRRRPRCRDGFSGQPWLPLVAAPKPTVARCRRSRADLLCLNYGRWVFRSALAVADLVPICCVAVQDDGSMDRSGSATARLPDCSVPSALCRHSSRHRRGKKPSPDGSHGCRP